MAVVRTKQAGNARKRAPRQAEVPPADNYVRTNVMLNERLLNEARELTGLRTKKETLEEALRTLVRVKKQSRLLELQGIGWEGDLAELRRSREFVVSD